MERSVAGYLDRWSARPGDDLQVYVSSDTPGSYPIRVVRLFGCDSRCDPPTYAEEPAGFDCAEVLDVARHPTIAGSCVKVDCSHQPLAVPERVTLTLFLHASVLLPHDAIIASLNADAVVVGIDGGGHLFMEGGGVRISAPSTVVPQRWTFLACTIDRSGGTVLLRWKTLGGRGSDEPEGAWLTQSGALPSTSSLAEIDSLHFGAGANAEARRGFTGKLEAPAIHAGSVAERDLGRLIAETGCASSLSTTLAAWDFGRDIGTESVSECIAGRHGETVQQPLRGVTGRLWVGSAFDWKHAPAHYGAIRFHVDDMADAGWPAVLRLKIPESALSGLYAVRVGTAPDWAWMPFYVLPQKGAATSDVAFLAPTASYLAYANVIVPTVMPEHVAQMNLDGPTDRFLLSHPEFGYSLYETHPDGAGKAVSTWHRPIVNVAPCTVNWGFTADGDIIAWLKAIGQPVDMLTDDVLDREGEALLAPYRVVITGTHPEYWSLPMITAVRGFLDRGGRLIYMGGNGFYWRVAFHPERPGVMEVRRADDSTRGWRAEPGEYYNSFDGGMGGLWRHQGLPPQRLVGVGFAAQGFGGGRPYERTDAGHDPRAAFIFDGIDGDVIGDFGSHGGAAAGEEIDRADAALGTPEHALVVASASGFNEAMLRAKEELLMTVPPGIADPDVRADMTFFETPAGGAVFSTGSISWSGSLAHNGYANSVAGVTGNVLRRFLDPRPFPYPGRTL